VDAPAVQLTVVVPVYNEERTVAATVDRLLQTAFPCPVEFVIVNDGSTDGTDAALASIKDARVRVIRHTFNRGKGAAVLTGIDLANGSHLLVFDADLEYLPADIPALLRPVVSGRAEVVYGSRIQGNHTVFHSLRYALGNRATTWVANILFDAFMKDLHTCLKLVPVPLLRGLRLRESGFGLDTEVTAKLLRIGIRPYEVPVSYRSRTHGQGKKLTWRDGIACLRILWCVRQRPAPVLAKGARVLESRSHFAGVAASAAVPAVDKMAEAPGVSTVAVPRRDEDSAVAAAHAGEFADVWTESRPHESPVRCGPLELVRR
jgi:glycosyltransferase involved in cell wall biosynthesis